MRKQKLPLLIFVCVAVIAVAFGGWSIWNKLDRENRFANAIALSGKTADLTNISNLEALQDSLKSMKDAIVLLESIPPSAGELYRNARKELKPLRDRVVSAEQIVSIETQTKANLEKAQTIATAASEIGKKPQISLKEWEEAYNKWQEAIAILKAAQDSRFFAPQVKQQLSAYEASLAVVSQKISTENLGVTKLRESLELAEAAAKLSQNPPHTSEVWQAAYQKWDEAISALESISGNALVSPEAKKRLIEYRKNRTIIQNQYSKQKGLEIQEAQKREFEEFFVGLSSSTKDSLRETKKSGLGRTKFMQICFQVITDNNTSSELAAKGYELSSYASSLCNYIWERL